MQNQLMLQYWSPIATNLRITLT